MSETFLDGRVTLYAGDSRDVLKLLADSSVDSVVTDPPYALVSTFKRFGKPGAAPAKHGSDGLYARASAGFMGQTWDTGETAFAVEFWAEVFRVLKPGAHVVAASSTRTYHRLAVAIEDAGFEIRDMVSWLYGSGFAKSHNVSNGIAIAQTEPAERRNERDRDGKPMTTDARTWTGWGTALKPACEPWVLARKPLVGTVVANVLAHGTGALNIDGCRVGFASEGDQAAAAAAQRLCHDQNADRKVYGDFSNGAASLAPYLAKMDQGRWPANVVHDGSDQVVGAFPSSQSSRSEVTSVPGAVYGGGSGLPAHTGIYGFNDRGSAARFFYSAKADADDRLGSKHPTVKPVGLMQWLCRLVTPPGGTVLDPFAGTGTTGEAAWREGFSAILIEREADYQADIRRRMALAVSSRATRAAAAATPAALDALPLFREGA